MTATAPRKPRPKKLPLFPQDPKLLALSQELATRKGDCDCGLSCRIPATDGTVTCSNLACRRVQSPRQKKLLAPVPGLA